MLNTSLGAFCFPPGRCSTRCDHDSQCTLLAGHGDRHETDHGCICYDPRQATRAEIIDAWKAANGYDDLLKAYSDAVDRVAAYEEVLTTRREHERRADDRLNDALSGEADAVRRAESAELGCEIAYRREPTQAEGDVHEYRHEQSMGASEAIRECHVPMGNHHGHRCLCGRWVWGGPTVCQRCVDAEAVKAALLRADTDARVKAEWEKLFNERNRLWREEADRVGAVTLLLEANGCDCDCDHDAESHDADCDRCLACRISWAIET